ncbi:hypothetical protein B0H17DRAFT_336787 [Mycena rosella]|uniref:Uncharacterized protein n=1 Tax=Mycena rosella TaxID=1033263 RepID=A0AAD7CRH3_MYCRO|nr:hypothetical protein B0H17DRAFT_336787 [Mycena rosella]
MQIIAGVEAMMNGPGAHGLQDQYTLCQNTYNKIPIIRAKKREIAFVSPQMLSNFAAPGSHRIVAQGSVCPRARRASCSCRR